jgi:hypothetical protein
MLLVVLEHGDVRNGMLQHLTVAEAGRCLTAVCSAARVAVGAFEQWRPMWNSEHAVERPAAGGAGKSRYLGY